MNETQQNKNENRNQNRQNHRSKRRNHPPKHKDKLKVIPIGGLGEIGKNMTVFEYKDEMIIVDCGLKFPDDEMYGIDIVDVYKRQFLVLPELVNAVLLFARSFPSVLESFQSWVSRILGEHSEASVFIQKLDTGGLESLNWDMLSKNLFSFFRGGAAGFLNTTLNVAASVAGGVFHTVIGLVVAVYLLFQKERLGLQTRKLLYAYLPEKRVDRLLEIAGLHTACATAVASCIALEYHGILN